MSLKMEIKTQPVAAVVIAAKVVPNSSRDVVVGLLGDALKIKVSRPPENGKANEAVIALLARTLDIAPSQIRVVAGQTQPHKRLEITGVDPLTLEARLLAK